MTIVDSSVWIDFFNGRRTRETDLLAQLLTQERIAIGDLILAEVLQGFKTDKDYLRAKVHLSALTFFEMGGKEIALKSVENYRMLRSKGVTIRKTMDMFIGTFCIEHEYKLLHADRDFNHLAKHLNLEVV